MLLCWTVWLPTCQLDVYQHMSVKRFIAAKSTCYLVWSRQNKVLLPVLWILLVISCVVIEYFNFPSLAHPLSYKEHRPKIILSDNNCDLPLSSNGGCCWLCHWQHFQSLTVKYYIKDRLLPQSKHNMSQLLRPVSSQPLAKYLTLMARSTRKTLENCVGKMQLALLQSRWAV